MSRSLFSILAIGLASFACSAQDVLPSPSTKSPTEKKFFYPFEISVKAGLSRHSLPYRRRPSDVTIIRASNTPEGIYAIQESVVTNRISASASVYVSRSVDIGLSYEGSPVPYRAHNSFTDNYRVMNMIPWLTRYGVFARYHYNIRSWDVNVFAGGGGLSGASWKGAYLSGGIGVNYHIVGGLYGSLQGIYGDEGVEQGAASRDFTTISAVAGVSFRF